MFVYEIALQCSEGHNHQPTDFSLVEVGMLGFFPSLLVVRQHLTYSSQSKEALPYTKNSHTKQQIQQANHLMSTRVRLQNNTIVGVLQAPESGWVLRRGRSAELRAELPQERHSSKTNLFHPHVSHMHLSFASRMT